MAPPLLPTKPDKRVLPKIEDNFLKKGAKKRLAMQTVRKKTFLIYGKLLKSFRLFCLVCMTLISLPYFSTSCRYFPLLNVNFMPYPYNINICIIIKGLRINCTERT